jgi:hypothetical protein
VGFTAIIPALLSKPTEGDRFGKRNVETVKYLDQKAKLLAASNFRFVLAMGTDPENPTLLIP